MNIEINKNVAQQPYRMNDWTYFLATMTEAEWDAHKDNYFPGAPNAWVAARVIREESEEIILMHRLRIRSVLVSNGKVTIDYSVRY